MLPVFSGALTKCWILLSFSPCSRSRAGCLHLEWCVGPPIVVLVGFHALFLILLGSHVGGFLGYLLPLEQRLKRSLLLGSDASYPRASDSAGSSYDPSRYSKPYVLCSATDVACAAIDFFKGSVDDGVDDSPPSRSPVRTPVCFPLPLQHLTSMPVRCHSHSPTPRTESTRTRN